MESKLKESKGLSDISIESLFEDADLFKSKVKISTLKNIIKEHFLVVESSAQGIMKYLGGKEQHLYNFYVAFVDGLFEKMVSEKLIPLDMTQQSPWEHKQEVAKVVNETSWEQKERSIEQFGDYFEEGVEVANRVAQEMFSPNSSQDKEPGLGTPAQPIKQPVKTVKQKFRESLGIGIGRGAYKTVYIFNDYVLKIANLESGDKNSINLESDEQLQTEFAGSKGQIIPKVFYKDPQGVFSVAQKVNTFGGDSDGTLSEILPIIGTSQYRQFVRKWEKYFLRLSKFPNFGAFEVYFTLLMPLSKKAIGSSRRIDYDSYDQRKAEYFKEFKELLKDDNAASTLLDNIIRFYVYGKKHMPGVGLATWDLKLDNLGWVKDGDKKRIVILDILQGEDRTIFFDENPPLMKEMKKISTSAIMELIREKMDRHS